MFKTPEEKKQHAQEVQQRREQLEQVRQDKINNATKKHDKRVDEQLNTNKKIQKAKFADTNTKTDSSISKSSTTKITLSQKLIEKQQQAEKNFVTRIRNERNKSLGNSNFHL